MTDYLQHVRMKESRHAPRAHAAGKNMKPAQREQTKCVPVEAQGGIQIGNVLHQARRSRRFAGLQACQPRAACPDPFDRMLPRDITIVMIQTFVYVLHCTETAICQSAHLCLFRIVRFLFFAVTAR